MAMSRPTYSSSRPKAPFPRTPSPGLGSASNDPTSPTYSPPEPVYDGPRTPRSGQEGWSQVPTSPTYWAQRYAPIPAPPTNDTAMLQLMQNSAEAQRNLCALLKEQETATRDAHRDMARHKSVMRDIKNEITQATAEFAIKPELIGSDDFDQLQAWKMEFVMAQDKFDSCQAGLDAYMTKIAHARDACHEATRAQDAFLVAQGHLDPENRSAWGDDSDGDEDIGSVSDISSLHVPDIVANLSELDQRLEPVGQDADTDSGSEEEAFWMDHDGNGEDQENSPSSLDSSLDDSADDLPVDYPGFSRDSTGGYEGDSEGSEDESDSSEDDSYDSEGTSVFDPITEWVENTPWQGMVGTVEDDVWYNEHADESTLIEDDSGIDDVKPPREAPNKRKATAAADNNAIKKRTQLDYDDSEGDSDEDDDEDDFDEDEDDFDEDEDEFDQDDDESSLTEQHLSTERKLIIPTGTRGKVQQASPDVDSDSSSVIFQTREEYFTDLYLKQKKKVPAPPAPVFKKIDKRIPAHLVMRKHRLDYDASLRDAEIPDSNKRPRFRGAFDIHDRGINHGYVAPGGYGSAYVAYPLRAGMVRTYCRSPRGGHR